MTEKKRTLLVFDGEAWFIRGVRVSEHNLERDEQVYRCNEHLGGPFTSLSEATRALKKIVEAKYRATSVAVNAEHLSIQFGDGAEIRYSFDISTRLRLATYPQRLNFQLLGDGEGIRWPEIDEDLSTAELRESGIIRCFVTGNPCGTDTWAVGYPCACRNCQVWLYASGESAS